MSDVEYPQDRTGEDWGHAVTTAGASAVPFVGGVLAGIIGAVWVPALERRRAEWLNQLSEDVESLGMEMAELGDRLSDEAVIDAATQAVVVAQRTRSDAKREALRAAVVNTVAGREPDADRRDLFIGLVDRLTEAHLTMLHFLADPRAYAEGVDVRLQENLMAGSLSNHVTKVFPEWSREIYTLLVSDLDAAGLSAAGSALHTMMTGPGTFESRITPFGRDFLDFVTSPAVDEGS